MAWITIWEIRLGLAKPAFRLRILLMKVFFFFLENHEYGKDMRVKHAIAE